MIKISSVKVLPDYKLELHFSTGEQKIFDTKPYLELGDFTELKNEALFNTVHTYMGTVQWDNELDIAPETLYLESVAC